MRVFRFLLILCCALAIAVPEDGNAARKRSSKRAKAPVSLGVNDPRYAAIVMDPKTGEIFHQAHANDRRYPASLTKMMTLYLLFDAIKKDKIGMDDEMDVSALAANQPQTHINLEKGDEVPVDLAIKAMVVRSANDVAVVIAEHLGGSVPGFARMMNEKARALGMTGTHFKNPHGLPDEGQYTTARDMAKLGIALKRDFPEYYPYFGTREFSWNGVTYYTHNRVMLRYSGVDGIKTGYIGKSGFNVVTSVARGGRPLIAVVMGGSSSRWRDDRMITLLNTGYTVLASRGNKRGKIYAQNLPRLPDGTAVTIQQAAVSDEAVRGPTDVASVEADRGILRGEQEGSSPFDAVGEELAQGDTEGEVSLAPALSDQSMEGKGWGIQVGAFSNRKQAERAVHTAKDIAGRHLKTSKLAPLDKSPRIYRVRLESLSEQQARAACDRITAKNAPCFVYRVGMQNL